MRIVLLIVAALLSGCAGPTLLARPIATEAASEVFTAKLEPADCVSWAGCRAFRLQVKNLTDHPIEIDWTRTQFVDGGASRGGFMWEGVMYAQRDAPKSPDIILPRGTLAKNLYPNVLVSPPTSMKTIWSHDAFTEGEKGIFLTVADGQRALATALTFSFEPEPSTRQPRKTAEPARPAEVITVRGAP